MTETARRLRQLGELLAPAQVLGRDLRVQQLLEEVELGAVGEDHLGDPAAVDRAVVSEHPLPELAHDRLAHLRIRAQEVMDDLVARDGRRTRLLERVQRLALAGADPAGDRDRDRPRHVGPRR